MLCDEWIEIASKLCELTALQLYLYYKRMCMCVTSQCGCLYTLRHADVVRKRAKHGVVIPSESKNGMSWFYGCYTLLKQWNGIPDVHYAITNTCNMALSRLSHGMLWPLLRMCIIIYIEICCACLSWFCFWLSKTELMTQGESQICVIEVYPNRSV